MAMTEQADAARPTTLVLRALGLGDLLTAVPALRALRRAQPSRRLILAAPAALADLLPAVGAVDALLAVPGLGGAVRWPGPPPELGVNLHGKGPQSIALLRGLRPGELWSHAHPDHPDLRGPTWRADLHEVDRWCRLLAAYGVPVDGADLGLHRPGVASSAPGAVIVHPGAAFPARRWPPERYARVAAALAADGHRVVITGNVAERALAGQVAELAGLPAEAVLAGRTDLATLAALVAGASLVVCGDTGMAHLATAYETPSVVLFGPVSPALWGPPPGRRQHVALWAGRSGDPFGAQADPGLLRLSVPQVLAAARNVVRAPDHPAMGKGGAMECGDTASVSSAPGMSA